jgi:hypothetical protein
MDTYTINAGAGALGSGVAFSMPFGVGLGGAEPIKPNENREYVAGGFAYVPNIPQVLSGVTDDVARDFGPQIYEAMLADPIVIGHLEALIMAVLAGEVEILAAVRRKPGAKKTPLATSETDPATTPEPTPAAPPGTGSDAPPAPAPPAPEPKPIEDPEHDLAVEIRDYCLRQKDRSKTDFKTMLFQILQGALLDGHKLVEKVMEIPVDGIDANHLCLKDLKVKPRWSWRFVVDTFMNPLGVLTFDPASQKYVIIPESKYAVLTWLPRDSDPRGRCHLRAAYKAWNVKQLLWAQYYAFLTQFAGPSLIGNTDPEELDQPATDANGNLIPDAPPVTPAERMAKQVVVYRNGSYIILPPNAKLEPQWPQGDGETFLKAIDFCDRQMAFAILYSIRATMESKFGSRADSETSQDQVGLIVRYARDLCETLLEDDICYPLVEARWGKDIADRLTPKVLVGKTEHQDFASYVHAIANLMTSGYLTEGQLPDVDSLLGIAIRGSDEEPLMYRQNASPGRATTPPVSADGQIQTDPQGKSAPTKAGARS